MARHLLADAARAARASNATQRLAAQQAAIRLAPDPPLPRGYRAALVLVTRGERPRDSAVASMARSLELAAATYFPAVR